MNLGFTSEKIDIILGLGSEQPCESLKLFAPMKFNCTVKQKYTTKKSDAPSIAYVTFGGQLKVSADLGLFLACCH